MEHEIRVLCQLCDAKTDAQRHIQCAMHIISSRFNLKPYSNEQCLIGFRFYREDLPRICELFESKTACTSPNRYRCEPLNVICMVLHQFTMSIPVSRSRQHVWYAHILALWGVLESIATNTETFPWTFINLPYWAGASTHKEICELHALSVGCAATLCLFHGLNRNLV